MERERASEQTALFLLSLLLIMYPTTLMVAKNSQGDNPGEGSSDRSRNLRRKKRPRQEVANRGD